MLSKYAEQDIHAVVVSDDPAFNLLKKYRDDIFHSVPIVYVGINRITEDVLSMKNATGVFENRDLAQTMRDIKQIFNTEDLIVISDESITGKANISKIRDEISLIGAPKNVYIINKLEASEVSKTFSSFSSDIPVLVVGQLYDDIHNYGLMKWTEGIGLLTSQGVRMNG